MTEADSGSDDDSGQVTTPAENPNDGNTNPTPSNPEIPKATYTITFDANGGTGEMNPQTAESGTEITLPENAFTKDGWIFAGWATSADGDVSYSDKATITVTGNITLYAKWAVTAANISEAIKNIPADGKVHTVALVGEISEDTITAIRSALYENSGARISLDLGQTTGLTSIGNYAFMRCSSLISVNIPGSVTSIGNETFSNCDNLTSVNIPASVTSIGEYAFQLCSSLTNVNIPDGVKSIGNSTFSDCSSLTSVSIPDSVESIGTGAFFGCTSLTSVNISNGVTSIGHEAFRNCSSLTSVSIPATVVFIAGKVFYGCTSLTELTVSENNGIYKSDGNCIYSEDGKTLIAAAAGLTSVTISEGIISIGGDAFCGCLNLTSVNIPNSVTSIENSAFGMCTKLTCISIPNSVTSIGENVFNGSGLTTITIPDGVTSIGGYTFSWCYCLKTVSIPASVTSIGEALFFNCDGLTTVKYGGTKAQWDALIKDVDISLPANATVECTEA